MKNQSINKKNSGFTLIELIVTLSVIAIIATLAVPAMQNFIDKRKAIGAAEEMYSNLQLARSEAIARNQIVAIRFNTNVGPISTAPASTWQYGISTNTTCNASQTLSDLGTGSPCVLVIDDGDGNLDDGSGSIDAADVVLFRFNNTAHPGVTLALSGTDFLNRQLPFDPTRGTLGTSEKTMTFTSPGGFQMRLKVSRLGQVRICSPSGTGHVPGYTSDGC